MTTKEIVSNSTNSSNDDIKDNTNKITKSNKVVVFHRIYNEDLDGFFQTLKELKKVINFKYTHGNQFVFIKLNGDDLTVLSENIKFQISRYYTVSEYSCPENIAKKICEQLETFVIIKYDEENKKIVFTSRIQTMEHLNIVIKIFNRAEVKFYKTCYKVVSDNKPNFKKSHNDENENEYVTVENDSKSYKSILNKNNKQK